MHRFRKRLCIPLILFAVMFILTGCIKVNIDITIKKNGKADISLLFAVQDSLTSLSEGESMTISEEEAEQYREEGWEVKDYAADGYTGYILAKSDVDLSSEEIMEGAESSIRKEGSLYIIDMDLLPDEDPKEFTESASMMKSMGGEFIVRLTLPVKPEKHNATSVSEDGKTLEWDLFTMNVAEPIHVEFRTTNYGLIIALAAVLAALAAVAAFLFLKKTKPQAEPVSFEEAMAEEAVEMSPAEEKVSELLEKYPAEEPAAQPQAMPAAATLVSQPMEMPPAEEPVAQPQQVFQQQVPAQEAVQPQEAPQQAAPPQKICINCGMVLADNMKFCPNCGTKVEATPAATPEPANEEAAPEA